MSAALQYLANAAAYPRTETRELRGGRERARAGAAIIKIPRDR